MTDVDTVVAGAGIDPAVLAARCVVQALNAALEARGRARWVLAGGATPVGLYRRLAQRHGADVDWSRVEFFWGDERCVPPASADSNFARAREALLAHVPTAPGAVHRIAGELGGRRAAADYDATVGAVLHEGPWDLVLLGLGADGHTASLFPPVGADAAEIPATEPPGTEPPGTEPTGAEPWVVAATAPVEPRDRVTLTARALSRSLRVVFLVAGAAKAGAVRRALAGDPRLPVTRVRPLSGSATWCLDEAAASAWSERQKDER